MLDNNTTSAFKSTVKSTWATPGQLRLKGEIARKKDSCLLILGQAPEQLKAQTEVVI